LQGFYLLMELEAMVACRAADKDKVAKAMDTAAQIYKAEVGSGVKATIDTSNPLPASSAGGVVLSAQASKIKVDNTLEARLASRCFLKYASFFSATQRIESSSTRVP